jgi:GINS complex subunit 4
MNDISDILNDVSRNDGLFEDDPFASQHGIEPGQADLEALTRAWINERGAPELLP